MLHHSNNNLFQLEIVEKNISLILQRLDKLEALSKQQQKQQDRQEIAGVKVNPPDDDVKQAQNVEDQSEQNQTQKTNTGNEDEGVPNSNINIAVDENTKISPTDLTKVIAMYQENREQLGLMQAKHRDLNEKCQKNFEAIRKYMHDLREDVRDKIDSQTFAQLAQNFVQREHLQELLIKNEENLSPNNQNTAPVESVHVEVIQRLQQQLELVQKIVANHDSKIQECVKSFQLEEFKSRTRAKMYSEFATTQEWYTDFSVHKDQIGEYIQHAEKKLREFNETLMVFQANHTKMVQEQVDQILKKANVYKTVREFEATSKFLLQKASKNEVLYLENSKVGWKHFNKVTDQVRYLDNLFQKLLHQNIQFLNCFTEHFGKHGGNSKLVSDTLTCIYQQGEVLKMLKARFCDVLLQTSGSIKDLQTFENDSIYYGDLLLEQRVSKKNHSFADKAQGQAQIASITIEGESFIEKHASKTSIHMFRKYSNSQEEENVTESNKNINTVAENSFSVTRAHNCRSPVQKKKYFKRLRPTLPPPIDRSFAAIEETDIKKIISPQPATRYRSLTPIIGKNQ